MPKKRHHYIPQFYLQYFIDPNNKPYIWVYDKEGKEEIKKLTAKDIAVEKHYFSFYDLDGSRDSESLENALAEIESRAAFIFQKIIEERTFENDDKIYFAAFIAFIMTRVPSFRQNIKKIVGETEKRKLIISASNEKYFESLVKRYEKGMGKTIGMPVEDLRKWILEGKYEIKPPPQYDLPIAMSAANHFMPMFYAMKWTFIKATDSYKFLTSDNPVFYWDPTHDSSFFYGVGLLNKNIELTFPLTKDLALLSSWTGDAGYVKANNQMVKVINRRTVMSALRFVFASEKSNILNKFVQKYINSGPKLVVR